MLQQHLLRCHRDNEIHELDKWSVSLKNPYLNIPTYTISHLINGNYDGIRHVVLFSFIGDITRKLFCIESFENANFTKLLKFCLWYKISL